MSVLRSRLRKLEDSIRRRTGRQIVVRSSQHMSNEDMAAFLAGHGITQQPTDDLLHFITIYEDDSNVEETAVDDAMLFPKPWVLREPVLIRCAPLLRNFG